jgi:hypothetical protein
MDKHATIFLIKILDRPSFGIEFYGAGNGGRKFLVREIDACQLRVEGAGNK